MLVLNRQSEFRLDIMKYTHKETLKYCRSGSMTQSPLTAMTQQPCSGILSVCSWCYSHLHHVLIDCDLSCVHVSSHCQCMSFLRLTVTFYWFLLFCFPVLCPLLADWALCCMLVIMSQFECSQTVSRTMGIQVNKGKVNPLTHDHLSSPIISQSQPATLLTHIQTRFSIPWSKWGGLSGREWASSTNTEASQDGFRCFCCSIFF